MININMDQQPKYIVKKKKSHRRVSYKNVKSRQKHIIEEHMITIHKFCSAMWC